MQLGFAIGAMRPQSSLLRDDGAIRIHSEVEFRFVVPAARAPGPILSILAARVKRRDRCRHKGVRSSCTVMDSSANCIFRERTSTREVDACRVPGIAALPHFQSSFQPRRSPDDREMVTLVKARQLRWVRGCKRARRFISRLAQPPHASFAEKDHPDFTIPICFGLVRKRAA